MRKKYFPKVLVISSSSFNDFTGTGVTLSNLFRDWPKDKLALIHSDNLFKPNEQICNYCYKHSLKDRRLLFFTPITKIFKIVKSAINALLLSKSKIKTKKWLNRTPNDNLINKIINFLGSRFENLEPLTRIEMTERMRLWILDFKPEIIYSTFSTMNI